MKQYTGWVLRYCRHCFVPTDTFDEICRLLRRADPKRCMVTEGVVDTLKRVIAERDQLRKHYQTTKGADIARGLGFDGC